MSTGPGPLTSRPAYLRGAAVALVGVGGACGAASRETLSRVIPELHVVPVSIAIINVVGAFLLGCLYAALTRLPSDDPRATRLRLLLGTGFCGGFTTYSSLAVDTAVLFRDGHPWEGSVYGGGTVLVGALASWLGIVVASTVNRSKQRRSARHAGGEGER